MSNAFCEHNFSFHIFSFNKYHYTDNRGGSPMNYIGYMNKGRGRLVCDYNTIEVYENEGLFIPKGLAYQSFWYGEDEVSFISLGYENMPVDDEQNLILQKLQNSIEINEKIKSIPTGRAVTAKTLSLFYDMLSDIIPNMKYMPKNKEMRVLYDAKKYIEENSGCSIPQAAEACFVSESYLYYTFKKNLKITPNDYRQKVLCEKAVSLLKTTDKKIDEIADCLDFSSASYLRKVLKKHIGKTPREIRKISGI